MSEDFRQLANKKDMWLSEKAGHGLREACELVDWFRRQELDLSERDSEFVNECLYEIIRRLASIVAYAENNEECLKRGWIELMAEQGVERFLEFENHIGDTTHNDVTPLPWILSFQKVSNGISKAESTIQKWGPNRTLVREAVLECARELKKVRIMSLRGLGNELLNLVDRQTVLNELTWDEFVEKACTLLNRAENLLKDEWEIFKARPVAK